MNWTEYAILKRQCDECINAFCTYCPIDKQLESFEKEEDDAYSRRYQENPED